MAIVQSRLITLLEIIDKFQTRVQAFRSFKERLRVAYNTARTVDEVLELYDQLDRASDNAVRLTDEEYRAFVSEFEHFKYTASKNTVAAKAMRRYRMKKKMYEEEAENENFLNQVFGRPAGDGPNPNRFVEVEVPKSTKPRDPWLDTLTLDSVHTLITKMQDELPEPVSASDIATIWRSRGGTDEEVMGWINRLLEEGLLVPGKYNGEYEVL